MWEKLSITRSRRSTHVYFPNRGIVSVVSVFENGSSVEVGMVGNEGMFGVCTFLECYEIVKDEFARLVNSNGNLV